MKIRLSFIFLFCLILFVAFVFYKSLFDDKNYAPKNINNKIENISIKEFYTDKNFYLKNLFEEETLMAINIWASWCIPCRQEHRYINKLSEIDNLKLVGLNYKDKKNSAQMFLRELGNPFDIILTDTDGTKSIFLGAYGVPETLILDRELKIIKKYIGPINSDIVNEIKTIIK
jgi:cytochrome c biogenesis protein CcmG/thiol:disulfide interchange protein DsbE|tara:strand:- start:1443 stop:1961 length:519 start_codon:yes stop_codon:yes gene_type:complete